MTRYEVTEKTRHSDNWIWLLLLLIAGFAIWRLYSPLAGFAIALLGLAILLITRLQGQKRVGNYVELDDKTIVFGQNGENLCITFAEIKKVKTCWLRSLLGGPSFIIETSTGTRLRLHPGDYENGEQLRHELVERFEQLDFLSAKTSKN